MRYFLAKNGLAVVDKQAFNGDNNTIDGIIDQFKTGHPALTVFEVDQLTFDGTVYTPPLTLAQQAWANFKATNPTALQAITKLAQYLGLE